MKQLILVFMLISNAQANQQEQAIEILKNNTILLLSTSRDTFCTGFFLKQRNAVVIATNAHCCENTELAFKGTALKKLKEGSVSGRVADMCILKPPKPTPTFNGIQIADDTESNDIEKEDEESGESQIVFTRGYHPDFGFVDQTARVNNLATIRFILEVCTAFPDSSSCEKVSHSRVMSSQLFPGMSGSPYVNKHGKLVGIGWGFTGNDIRWLYPLRAIIHPLKPILEFLK